MKLLHLEDEGPLAEIFETLVHTLDENVELIQFFSGDEAAAFVRDNHDEIYGYVLDIRVPGELDGLGVAQLIRDIGSTRPIIINSGYRKPDNSLMIKLNLEWMPKPMHLLNIAQKILPTLYST